MQQGLLVPPLVLLVLVLLVQQVQCLVAVVRIGTAGRQSWIQQKATLAVARTAQAVEEQIEVAQSWLAEAGSIALVRVLHRWLEEQRMSLALAVRTPWSEEPRMSPAARIARALRRSPVAARKQQVAEPHMSLLAARKLRTSLAVAP